MSLDRNLFTLNIVPNGRDPAFQDLVIPSGEVHYSKEREAGTSYRINLFGAFRIHLSSLALTQMDFQTPCRKACLPLRQLHMYQASTRQSSFTTPLKL